MNRRKKERRETIIYIFDNIIFTFITFLVMSIVFRIPSYNIAAAIFFIPLLGVSRYFLTQIQRRSIESKIHSDYAAIIKYLLVLEKAISSIQELCTDEDILSRCGDEISSELKNR